MLSPLQGRLAEAFNPPFSVMLMSPVAIFRSCIVLMRNDNRPNRTSAVPPRVSRIFLPGAGRV